MRSLGSSKNVKLTLQHVSILLTERLLRPILADDQFMLQSQYISAYRSAIRSTRRMSPMSSLAVVIKMGPDT
jgi:hypothetical protein